MTDYRVKLIVAPNRGRFPYSNCLLLKSTSTGVLIDSGCGVDSIKALRDRIDAVIYTHYHPDHISGHHLLAGIKTFAPEGEEPYKSLEDLAKRFASTHYREWMAFARSYVGVMEVPIADEYFKPGDSICIGSLCINTIHAPGHLMTHTILEIGGHVHLTDIDLTGFGPWYANPESDPIQFLADISMAGSLDATMYTTSHREEKFNPEKAREALKAYAYRLVETALAVYKAMDPDDQATGWSLAGKGIIYKRYIQGAERLMKYFEAVMISKLLSLLYAAGCVKRKPGGYVKGECNTGDLMTLATVG